MRRRAPVALLTLAILWLAASLAAADPHFSLSRHDDGTTIVTDGDGRTFRLSPRVAANRADGDLTVPLRRVVFLSSTQASVLELLNEPDLWRSVVGVTGDTAMWRGTPLASGLANGRVKLLGRDDGAFDYEALAALHPDMVFVRGGPHGQRELMARLDGLGIAYAVDDDYTEPDFLDRMAWCQFVAAFFDRSDVLATRLASARRRVDDVRARVVGHTARAVVVGSPFLGVFYVPSPAGWLGDMLRRLGATDPFPTGGRVSAETFFAAAAKARLMICTVGPAWLKRRADLLAAAPLLARTLPFETGQVWQVTDAFWRDLGHSDAIFAELAALLYPTVFPSRSFRFFRLLPP